ncbi:unnamed protein product [Rhizoctonia solani]|uniref:LYR motif-containing protein 2 n=1 Tax=Rhizoctonia solani TaxID=456999 RepID=A0A8H3GMV1_9AGAM|nr:unnamed protein product [Rhizoctonia solani]
MQRTLSSGGLTLRHFLLKAEVLSVYRQVIRSCRRIPDAEARRETLEWFKHDFRRNANTTDLVKAFITSYGTVPNTGS